MARGDHIKVERNTYWHHGIDVGNNEVVHYAEAEEDDRGRLAKLLSKKTSGTITKTSIDEFSKGAQVEIAKKKNTFDAETVVKRAERMVGKPSKYNLIFNNCEHFANWCGSGDKESKQVKKIVKKVAKYGTFIVGGILAKKLMGKDIIEQIDFVLKVGGDNREI